MATDLGPTIATASANPNSATVDGVSVRQNDLNSVIAADRYLAAKDAAVNGRFPIQRFKLARPNPGDVRMGCFNSRMI